MERMLIKHLSGSKANQVEEFALKHHTELVFGREASSTVKYDPDRDDLVGREHAKIARDPSSPTGFSLTDLNSKNGTFLNSQRVTGTVQLNIGDSVQFGPGGPEFTFDVEPRPDQFAKTTRIADAGRTATPATRTIDSTAMAATAGGGKPTVGKATVERMITETATETRKAQGKKYGIIGGIAAILVLMLFGVVIAGGYWYYSTRESELKGALDSKTAEIQKSIEADKASAPKAAADIAEKFSNAVVQFEVAWRLLDPSNANAQVYHLHLPARLVSSVASSQKKSFTAQSNYVPVYVQVGNAYEPVLVTSSGDGANKPIGGVHTGTGFIVTTDGYILTNRHVAATWMTSYQFPENTPRGIVLSPNLDSIVSFEAQPPTEWVPAYSKSSGGNLGLGKIRVSSPSDYSGVNDKLQIAMPGTDARINARLLLPSDRHDVALVKMDKPGELTKVELFDNYDELKKGQEVVMMGYPGVTAPQYGLVTSQDMFNPTTQLKTIPNPTVTVTSVSNILRDSPTKETENIVKSTIGDVIQLSTGSTGPGNSGGPVFDMQGRVIGIYFGYKRGADLQYVVPIRYGMQIMK